MTRAALIAALLALASGARAQDRCASSFPARLDDAKRAVVAYADELERFDAARPAVEWFGTHCRFLNALERAARKVDDANAFVCDASKPAGLTAELVLRYTVEPSVGSFQLEHGANHRCLESDRAARVALVFVRPSPLEQLAILCWDSGTPRCVAARAAAARAQVR